MPVDRILLNTWPGFSRLFFDFFEKTACICRFSEYINAQKPDERDNKKTQNAGNGKEKNMGFAINAEKPELDLYEVIYIPKGQKEEKTVYVWAKNSLDASNELIFRKMWGKQKSVEYHSTNYSREKERSWASRHA